MKLYTALLLIFVAFTGRAQYGNEWINYSQQYFVVKVAQNGIYRIDSTTLANAGIDLSAIDPRNFQLFGREKEQAIFINGENDGVFNNGDYIEFLGLKNDGWLDSLLYNGANEMPDLYYSLYNDTSRYYLTFNTSLANRRAKFLTDTSFSAYPLAPYYMVNSFIKHADEYYVGPQLEGASKSMFVDGEGWYGSRFQGVPGGGLYTDNVPTSLSYNGVGAPAAIIKTRAASTNNAAPFSAGGPNHSLEIDYGALTSPILDTEFYGYYPIRKNLAVPVSNLGATTTPVNYRIVDDIGVDSDVFNVASTSIEYPHLPDFAGTGSGEFWVEYNATQPYTNYAIANYSGAAPLVYMVGDSVWRSTGELSGSTLKLLVPNDAPGQSVTCHVFNSTINVTQLKPINNTGYFTNYGSLMVDSAYIIITHKVLDTGAIAYANYRASVAGGSHNTIVIYVDELYDQFAAGVYKHILGLRRFCDMAIHTWPSKPNYLLILGKSIREATEGLGGATSHGTRKSAARYKESLVPSYGYPSSDNRITAGLDGTFYEPAIPTGRISATNKLDDIEVMDYLSKMQEYEQAQQLNLYTKTEKDWMKHVLEFGGGANSFEQIQFRTYLLNYKAQFEDSSFAGTVDTSFKTSSEPIDPIDFQEINQRIDDGVSMMLFFGHASIGGFDQNVDDVNNWSNTGRYPLLIGNACYTGDIHQPGALSVSEEFTLVPNKGVIGFLSTVKQGFVNELNLYSDQLVKQLSRISYGQSIGKNIKKTVQYVQAGVTTTDPISSIPAEEVFTGMTLHGDPALKLNSHEFPELVIETSDAFIEPENITLADDSMDVNLIITNLGRGTYVDFTADLVRTFPNGADSAYSITVNGVRYKDTVTFRIPVYHAIAFGTNHFSISIDVEHPTVQEQYDEVNNNKIEFDYTISGNSIFPVYPYEFAIVPDSVITFSASTVDPFAPTRAYRFELDTTDLFNSPFKRFVVVNSVGGVLNVNSNDWLLQSTGVVSPLVHTDSTVYFWRVSPDSTTLIWQESSYQYINDKVGWGQAHFFQFKKNDHSHLIYDKPGREWEFEALDDIVSINVLGFPTTFSETSQNGWFINGINQEYDGVGGGTFSAGVIYVAVIDPFDPDPWHTFDGSACTSPSTATNIRYEGQFNCRPITAMGRCRGEYYFGFRQSQPQELDSLYDFITNDIPCGHYVMMWTFGAANFAEWDTHSPEMYTMFQDLGVTGLTPGMANRPLLVMGRKCDTSSTKFLFGDTVKTGVVITLSDTIAGILPGTMESVKIGPAYNWETLYWKQHPMESPITGDSTVLSLYGITHSGAQYKLFDTLFTRYDSILNLNGVVDAATYPYLKLRARTVDNITHTPAYFDRWQILYAPAPEAALNPQDGFYLSANGDSLAEGDEIKFAIAIKNIGKVDMDSLLVHYYVEDANRIRHYINYERQDSLKIGETLFDTVTIPTINVPGNNYLWVEANPVPLTSTTGQYDQLEQYHFNNVARIPFQVTDDNENPVLDVTFDGRHIINGDIVSAKPFVVMSLDDENEFLIMNEAGDTSRFLVYLTDPNGVERKVFFNVDGVPQMNFIPAGSDNKCKIEWNASFATDGVYTLRVRAWDKNDNRSGDKDYKISFEVILRQTITHVMNYPNPFSTKTHFVFTLTGSEVPQYMKIQIFNVSGKVVREIMADELGPLYIGKNITEYAWDGRDEFGDQLANGVYFYRVISKDSGFKDIENRETQADQYFRKGFGKMYLMR